MKGGVSFPSLEVPLLCLQDTSSRSHAVFIIASQLKKFGTNLQSIAKFEQGVLEFPWFPYFRDHMLFFVYLLEILWKMSVSWVSCVVVVSWCNLHSGHLGKPSCAHRGAYEEPPHCNFVWWERDPAVQALLESRMSGPKGIIVVPGGSVLNWEM